MARRERHLIVGRVARRLLLALSLIVLTSAAPAQVWVASTASVDEGSRSSYQFSGPNAWIRTSLSAASAILRYNVLPVGDLTKALQSGQCRKMLVRAVDNGSDAQVLVKLQRYNLNDGSVTTLLSYDSNNFSQSSVFAENASNCAAFDFSFAD